MITELHDQIVDRLTRCSSRSWSVYKKNQPLVGSLKCPDLVLAHNSEIAAILIDVACTFEDGPAAFDAIRTKKLQKYAYLKKSLASKFKEVSIEAIVVGALCSWDPKNNRICHRLCSRKYTKLMKKLIVSGTLRASRDIYITHLNRHNPQLQPSRYRQFFNSIADSVLRSESAPVAGPSSQAASAPVSSSSPPAVIVAQPSSFDPASDPAINFAIELSSPLFHGNLPSDNIVDPSDTSVAQSVVPAYSNRNSREPESEPTDIGSSYPPCAQQRNRF